SRDERIFSGRLGALRRVDGQRRGAGAGQPHRDHPHVDAQLSPQRRRLFDLRRVGRWQAHPGAAVRRRLRDARGRYGRRRSAFEYHGGDVLDGGAEEIVHFGTNANSRRGLSTRIPRSMPSPTLASRGFGANTVTPFAISFYYPSGNETALQKRA